MNTLRSFIFGNKHIWSVVDGSAAAPHQGVLHNSHNTLQQHHHQQNQPQSPHSAITGVHNTASIVKVLLSRLCRGRGAAGDAAEVAAENDDDDAQPSRLKPASTPASGNDADNDILTPAQAAKKARISAMFEQLHESCTCSANKLSKSNISLASLCSNIDPKKKKNTDLVSIQFEQL